MCNNDTDKDTITITLEEYKDLLYCKKFVDAYIYNNKDAKLYTDNKYSTQAYNSDLYDNE